MNLIKSKLLKNDSNKKNEIKLKNLEKRKLKLNKINRI